MELVDTFDGGLHFKSFDTSLRLVKVIAGARCGTSLQELKNAVRSLTDVEFIRAGPDLVNSKSSWTSAVLRRTRPLLQRLSAH